MASLGRRSGRARRSAMVFAVLAGRLLRFRRTDLRSPDVRHRYVGDAGLWLPAVHTGLCRTRLRHIALRSEEHTSELQSLMRISYAVFCLKKKLNNNTRY